MAALKTRDRYLASADIATKYPSDVDANGYIIGHPETELTQVVDLARQNSKAYTLNTVVFVASLLASGLVLECTTAGTTAATEPSYTGAAAGGTVTDGTVVWTYKSLLSCSHSIGEIFAYVGTTPPPGALLCDHSPVSRTAYAKLYAEIGTTFGAGDGSTTFNLPSAADARYLVGSTTAGQMIDAGLPNITGNFLAGYGSGSGIVRSAVGAFYGEGDTQSVYGTSTSYDTKQTVQFDASRSSSVYGNSNTVTPKSLSVKYYIQAFNASTDPALVDLTELAQDLANKLPRSYARRTRKAFTLENLALAVANNDYAAYDILPGDYFVGASGYTYIFAGANPMKGPYAGYPINENHAGLIVDTHETCKWNETNDTTGGYVSSKLHTYLVNTVLPKVKTDLGGVSHLYSHQKLYSTGINKTGYNRYGTATGCTNNRAWSADQYIAALSEVQVYGSIVWSSSGYDTGEADQQLEVFKRFKHTEIFGNEYPWLRDVVSATAAASADYGGAAYYYGASNAYYVAGLIAFH